MSQSVRINVLGSVPAGVPIKAITDIVDWEEIPFEWTRGGQDAIVYVDGYEATLKKVIKEIDHLILQPWNLSHNPPPYKPHTGSPPIQTSPIRLSDWRQDMKKDSLQRLPFICYSYLTYYHYTMAVPLFHLSFVSRLSLQTNDPFQVKENENK